MQKMKITIPVIIVVILAIVGGAYYVFSNRIQVDKNGGVTLKKDDIITQETSYEKNGNLFKFTKNRITKTATFDMVYNLADKDEFSDFMGSKITTVPFLVNFLCGTLNQAFFNPAALQTVIASNSADTTKATNITDDNQFKNALSGYRVSEFSLDFKDKTGQIATCQSNQKGFENIKFTVIRDFSSYDSFLGQKIGVVK